MSNLDRCFLAGDHRHDVKVSLFNAALEFISVTEEDLKKAVKLKSTSAMQRSA
jgi:hypothetical protein